MNDIVLRGGRVVDGTGSPGREADVAIRDGIIVGIGTACGRAERELAVDGLTVAPGFIDMHAHADLYLLRNPGTDHRVLQGVTAEVAGNCGFSAAPLGAEWAKDFRQYARPVLGTWPEGAQCAGMADYLDALARTPLRHHAGALVGLGALRVAVRGYRPGRLAPPEMDRLIGLARESLDAGALGVSMGLMYVPEAYFETDELIRIASVAAEYGRPVTVHLRGEGSLLIPCIDEMIEVARRRAPPSTYRISKRRAGQLERALAEAIERLEPGGLRTRSDRRRYPYTAGSSTLLTLLPPCAHRWSGCAGRPAARRRGIPPPGRGRDARAHRGLGQSGRDDGLGADFRGRRTRSGPSWNDRAQSCAVRRRGFDGSRRFHAGRRCPYPRRGDHRVPPYGSRRRRPRDRLAAHVRRVGFAVRRVRVSSSQDVRYVRKAVREFVRSAAC